MKFSASDPLDSLVDLACRDGVDIRPTLLRVITDLYVQKPIHGLEEETQFVELALGLIDTVDASTRAAVAALPVGLSSRAGCRPSQARRRFSGRDRQPQRARARQPDRAVLFRRIRRTQAHSRQSRCRFGPAGPPRRAGRRRTDAAARNRRAQAQPGRVHPRSGACGGREPRACRTDRVR